MSAEAPIAAQLSASQRRRQHRIWYLYDWANSGYWTVTATVLIAPYLISVATRAACPGLAAGQTCRETISVLGVPVAPGSLPGYTVAFGTIVAFLLLPIVGALADRSPAPKRVLGWSAAVGSAAATGLFFVQGDNWQLGVVLLLIANIALALAQAVYDGILVQIALPEERDRVSSQGWALGYLGGFLLLGGCLVVLLGAQSGRFPISTELAVRIGMLAAGLWWAAFSVYPVIALWNRPLPPGTVDHGLARTVRNSFGQLLTTVRHLRGYPQTLRFLIAYLVFNDGIQTVITSSSTYASGQLGFTSSQLVMVILLVQFVAFVGALAFGRLAAAIGPTRTIFCGLAGWLVVIVAAFLTPSGYFYVFLAIAVGIGIVMGGTQALARSLYSQLIPPGREAEYFSLYQAGERGTSWLGALLFALVFQLSGSYRPALISLMAFFIVGALLLSRVRVAEGIRAAGNVPPPKV